MRQVCLFLAPMAAARLSRLSSAPLLSPLFRYRLWEWIWEQSNRWPRTSNNLSKNSHNRSWYKCSMKDAREGRPHESTGKEIFEIHPVILGGSPTDPANKATLTRAEHIRAVQYWNKILKDLR